MKYIFTFLFAFIFSICAFAQTEFAPLGAKWNFKFYSQGSFGSGKEAFKQNEVIADSISNGIRYVTIEERVECQGISYNQSAGEWQYNDRRNDAIQIELKITEDTVFYFNPLLGRYSPLYIYNVNVGDTFSIPLTSTFDNSSFNTCKSYYGEFGLDINSNAYGDSIITFVVDSIVNVNYNGTMLETYFVSNPLERDWSVWPFLPTAPQLNWFSEIYKENINSHNVTKVKGAYTRLFGGLSGGVLPIHYGDLSIADALFLLYSPCNYKDDSLNIHFSTNTNCDSFQVNAPLALKSIDLASNIKIYPNPAKDVLHINIEQIHSKINYSIFNILGNELVSPTSILPTKQAIDISHLPFGLHIIIFEFNGEKYYHKFIKE